MALSGCASKQYIPVETKITETREVRDTLVEVRLVERHDSVSLARDTASYLENPYAYSWARYEGGSLHHSLGTRKGSVLEVEVPQYTEITRKIEVPKIVEVEKSLSSRQKCWIALGKVCAASIFVNLVLIAILVWIRKKGGGH
jgi:hypothetical protein